MRRAGIHPKIGLTLIEVLVVTGIIVNALMIDGSEKTTADTISRQYGGHWVRAGAESRLGRSDRYAPATLRRIGRVRR